MATYVISDIHGCYETFLKLLKQVNFNDNDTLYILGDIIDRGNKSYEMYCWVKEHINKNVFMIVGNHEDMFMSDVYGLRGYMLEKKRQECMKNGTEFTMSEEDEKRYKYFRMYLFGYIADQYGTINYLSTHNKLSLEDFEEMFDFFYNLPYYYEIEVNNKKYTLVHAGCYEDIEDTPVDTFIWDRSFAERNLYIPNKNIIFGHTPTITSHYEKKGGIIIKKFSDNATTINIDCGCVWKHNNSSLGILRLDDLQSFYEKCIDDTVK